MPITTVKIFHSSEDQRQLDNETIKEDEVLKYKKRMLEWPNPVEYVNNMYGCHPDDNEKENEYFKVIFSK